MSHPIQKLRLEQINAGPTTQSRKLNPELVATYREAIRDSADFPACIVFHSGGKYLLADGYHRHEAAKDEGCVDILCEIREGTEDDAVRFAVGANTTHGGYRTNENKRDSVNLVMARWPGLSNRTVAEMCKVSPGFVDSIRKQVPTVGTSTEPTKHVGRDGKQYTIKPKAPAPTPAPVAAPTPAPRASAPTPEVKTTEVVEQVKVEPSKRLTKKEQERLERNQRLQTEMYEDATAVVYRHSCFIKECIAAEAIAKSDPDEYILHDPADVDKALDLLESHIATNPSYSDAQVNSPLRYAQLCILELQAIHHKEFRAFAIARISKLIAELRQARGGAR